MPTKCNVLTSFLPPVSKDVSNDENAAANAQLFRVKLAAFRQLENASVRQAKICFMHIRRRIQRNQFASTELRSGDAHQFAIRGRAERGKVIVRRYPHRRRFRRFVRD